MTQSARFILPGRAVGEILASSEPLSFWGGVDPATGRVIDVHHPLAGQSMAGRILVMPGTRGSCTGSGVLLDMALNGHAPAALVFAEPEDVVTLGAMIAAGMFGKPLPVLRLTPEAHARLAKAKRARITEQGLEADGLTLAVAPQATGALELTDHERAMLDGAEGEATAQAMRILCAMAVNQGATRLVEVTQGHIDGCIYASPANLIFAEKMADMGAKVRIPTTMNAISVDHSGWRTQGVPPVFGGPAQRLADAYVRMGCQPTFTCSPYLLDTAPAEGELIAWSESNAVIYANSVLGARTVKHADFMDLCIALTGRAAQAGVYLDRNRAPRRIIDVTMPAGADDAFWPMLGWLAGQAAPDRVPLIRGLEGSHPSEDDLKALCAAFGTTSAAPLLHIAGLTPEAGLAPAPDADRVTLDRKDFAHLWDDFNRGAKTVDLVALGSPHFSAAECAAFAGLMEGARVAPDVTAIVTLGRGTLAAITTNGVRQRLERAGVRIIPDLCWCSISEPVFPPQAKVLMTNSGKYAHYAPGLSNRSTRFGSLAHCAATAQSGTAPTAPPAWIAAPPG